MLLNDSSLFPYIAIKVIFTISDSEDDDDMEGGMMIDERGSNDTNTQPQVKFYLHYLIF